MDMPQKVKHYLGHVQFEWLFGNLTRGQLYYFKLSLKKLSNLSKGITSTLSYKSM